MKKIRKFKEGFSQSLFAKPKGKPCKSNVYAAHYLTSKQIWAFSK